MVASLRESGLSLRAIAAATGSSVNTVRDAIGHDDVYQSDTPAPDAEPAQPITGTDGKTYPAKARPSQGRTPLCVALSGSQSAGAWDLLVHLLLLFGRDAVRA